MKLVGKSKEIPVRLVKDPAELKSILDPTRWKILSALAESPDYPSRLASKLGLDEQKVYYHINKLREAGAISVAMTEERQGAIARHYKARDEAFAIALSDKWRPASIHGNDVPQLLQPFFSGGKLNAVIIVGSPDPHGPHQARARDTHFVSDLCLFFGGFCSEPSPPVLLDTDVKQAQLDSSNLILVGGPVTNMVEARINADLPVRIETGDRWSVFSESSGKRHYESAGMVLLQDSPWNSGKKMLVIAGASRSGTKAAVLAVMQKHDELGSGSVAKAVQGLDMDGDGAVDSVRILD